MAVNNKKVKRLAKVYRVCCVAGCKRTRFQAGPYCQPHYEEKMQLIR